MTKLNLEKMTLDELVAEVHRQRGPNSVGLVDGKLFDMMLLRNAQKYGFETWSDFMKNKDIEWKKNMEEFRKFERSITWEYQKD